MFYIQLLVKLKLSIEYKDMISYNKRGAVNSRITLRKSENNEFYHEQYCC